MANVTLDSNVPTLAKCPAKAADGEKLIISHGGVILGVLSSPPTVKVGTPEWVALNDSRGALIDKEIAGAMSSEERPLLAVLQKRYFDAAEAAHPLPDAGPTSRAWSGKSWGGANESPNARIPD